MNICSFLGHKALEVAVHKKAHTREDSGYGKTLEQIQKQAMIAAHGKEKSPLNIKLRTKSGLPKTVNACQGCGKEAEKPEGFKKCAACWKIN